MSAPPALAPNQEPDSMPIATNTGGVTAQPVSRLIDEFSRLPGIGPKTASRLAYHILKTPKDDAIGLAEAILDVKERITLCSVCFNTTDVDPCAICSNDSRENRILVVEQPLDVVAIERTHEYRGRYHVLHGAVSPVDGIGPDKLRIQELVDRVQKDRPEEVIVFTNLDLPGEATATYLHRILTPLGIRVTRPASGLPVGGDLEYADDMTLGRALKGRREL
jgi:recombination protein RecR